MSKLKAIEKANKKLLMESLPPMINFNDVEVFSIINEIEKNNLRGDKLWEFYRAKLKEKGKISGGNAPDGAFF